MRYQKSSDPPIFFTLEERTKEDSWGYTWKICILGQDKSLEVGEDHLTPTESPSQIPINLDEVYQDAVEFDLTREDMANMWSTKDLLGWYKREIIVLHHRLNHCSFKTLLRLSKRVIIPKNLSKVRKLSPCVAYLFGNPH